MQLLKLKLTKPMIGSDSIKIKLGGMRSNVRVYDPTVGDAALVGIPKTDSLQLSLSDHPVVVEIQLSNM